MHETSDESFTVWPKEAAERYRRAGHWAGRTFDDLLTSWARERPRRVALVVGDRTWTYGELHAEATQLAAGLRALGISAGERVLLQLPNSAEFVLAWFALQRLGAVPVHALPAHRASEIRALIQESGAVAHLIPDRHQRFDYRPMAAGVLADEPSLHHVLVCGEPGSEPGLTSLDELRRADTAPLPDRPAPPSAIAALLLSGGTTGRPKLIPRTHDDYAYNARTSAEAAGLTERSVYLAILPVGFNFTFACPGILGTFAAGGTVVIAPDPSPQTAFDLVERHGVTITAIGPTLVPHWLDEARHRPAGLGSLEVLQVGGARLPEQLARQLGEELGVTVQQVFGMAEGLVCVTGLDDPPELIRTTQGRPISPSDEVRVVAPDGREVADGEQGELLARGPYTIRGYYRAPEHNARAFTEDGFYRTGDLVRRLPSGHLIVTGRSKDQINRAGEKIAAAEVEEHLITHPAIRAAALVAAPDETWGERPVAFVVCDAPAPSSRELAGFLRDRGLAAFKAPDQVLPVDELPLTPLGKVDKKALRARLKA